MANISEDLVDLTISRQLVLQRVANGLSKQVAQHYKDEMFQANIETATPQLSVKTLTK